MPQFVLHIVPEGMRGILNWLKEEYNSVSVFLTETGCCEPSGTVDDPERVQFFKSHLNELLKGKSSSSSSSCRTASTDLPDPLSPPVSIPEGLPGYFEVKDKSFYKKNDLTVLVLKTFLYYEH